jgi:peptide/nickel transport system substrate-binding protein
MDRRQFLLGSAAATVAGMGAAGAQSTHAPGAIVDKRALITSNAQFDPARPEIARLISQACQSLGWQCDANPMDYNQGIQKVVMEHDFEMFLVILAGQPIRIDPQVFIHGLHHSSEIRRGAFNWAGYKNPRVDQLAEEQSQILDLEARRKPVFEAQRLIFEDQPGTVIAYPQFTQAHRSDKIRGLVPQLGEGIGSFWTDLSMEVTWPDGYSRTGANTDVKFLNPLAANDVVEFAEIGAIYDRLYRIDPSGKPIPWAATGLTIVDPTTIDVALRSGMKWHDGQPVTAEDVKFSFDYQKQWKAPFFAASLNNIESVTITGASAIRIKMARPFAPIISNLLAGLFLIPKHVWEKIPGGNIEDPLKFANENPIGSGPFRFEYWRRGAELKLGAFKEHFAPPKSAGFLRIVYGSHDATAAAIERGDCDRTRYILSASHVDQLKKARNVDARGYPTHGFYHLAYNNRIAPFNIPAFRQALNHVMPRQSTSELVMLGYAEPGGSVISPANAFWHNPEIKAPAEDVKKARDILAAAKFTWDSQGRLRYPT